MVRQVLRVFQVSLVQLGLLALRERRVLWVLQVPLVPRVQ